MSTTEQQQTQAPAWIHEAICPSCGRPTCPRCAQLEALEAAVEET